MGKPGYPLSVYVNQDERRQLVVRLYLQGLTMREVADKLGTTAPTVCKDIAVIRAQWKESALRDYNELLNRELARIDAVESAAWHAWDLSLRERQTIQEEAENQPADEQAEDSQKKKSPPKHSLEWIRRKLKTRREGQSGNPSYLQIVLECVEKRSKLLGLDEVKQAAGVEGTALTPDQEAVVMDATIPAGPDLESNAPNGEEAES
jgi:hypothetical protein